MLQIKFGPAGIGKVKEAINNLEMFSKLGLKACEIEFTHGVYIKNKQDAIRIGKVAKKLGIKLSIHASYWINLNSSDEKVIERSKKRILKCLETGTWLGADVVVFHAGYYGERKEKAFENIKKRILEIQKEIKKKKYTSKLAPETMGKVNVFGSINEIAKLVEETGCGFCIDFAHILAREKKVDMEKIKKLFLQKHWHCHFSGIEYGEKGEKHHKKTDIEGWKRLISNLPKKKEITIINESPTPVEDSVLGMRIFESSNTQWNPFTECNSQTVLWIFIIFCYYNKVYKEKIGRKLN